MCYTDACVFQIHSFSTKFWEEYKAFAPDDKHCVCMLVAIFCAKQALDVYFWNKGVDDWMSLPTVNKTDLMTAQVCFAKYFFKKWAVFLSDFWKERRSFSTISSVLDLNLLVLTLSNIPYNLFIMLATYLPMREGGLHRDRDLCLFCLLLGF